ncbi:hypothetical protein EVB94_255 [Rhizobium phage RHph_TM40]|uniref:Uncharacterized protein n=2 Tax=Cuauhnahuacvirus TaxID=3044696 RepID=A0A7S5RH90_9CAUD|nr:hypothetical protein PQC16_gp255 [Rhizobium phage RHph_TM30]YP_010671405.1 hypothetical protein PQC17_gp256 [Rhizobium phage RHph_Y65]QIG71726.1 hypothetical protein EVB94_255 [Rhizobium phage RHph_TM40]QIG72089.1 hypothetical protein EVB95_255 [Rhizobium phage RHph_TM2_3B]QIG72451.1 hypothetical protein EVB96_255 [Rhizobium phage RHph_TM3_3_6]QIG71362.1 hypothetical protein EVB93_255 [Rhizobium phage RHph_TM30]QIG72814.1 hypothetical protein EVB97_256 [Rhizobium phage RHph_Y65]
MSSTRAKKEDLTPEQIMELKETHVILHEDDVYIEFVPNIVETIMLDKFFSAINPEEENNGDNNLTT